MHFEFHVEDQSTAELVKTLLLKLAKNRADVTWRCRAYHGLGGFSKKRSAQESKTGKLLNDLETVLRSSNAYFQRYPAYSAALFFVLDNDKNDPNAFRRQLEEAAVRCGVSIDHVFCIAVEEMEAWLLGDEAALLAAYPSARTAVLRTYEQDSICGTWELLADAIFPRGYSEFKKKHPGYYEIGRCKIEWAQRIGKHMDPSANRSPSFQYFLQEFCKRLP